MMYSLDQVIYFLEQRQQTEDWNIRDAAIAYLKGYREVLPEYAQMKLDAVKNDPLTWDDLKQMEGKPVWVEYGCDFNQKRWVIIGSFHGRKNEFQYMDVSGGYPNTFWKKDMGADEYWQAYRKEHHE